MNLLGKGGFGDNPGHRNKNGRPKKGETITEKIRELLEQKDYIRDGKKITCRQAVAEMIVEDAISGDSSARRLLLNYVDGMPKQVLEHTGQGGDPIQIVFPKGFKGV